MSRKNDRVRGTRRRPPESGSAWSCHGGRTWRGNSGTRDRDLVALTNCLTIKLREAQPETSPDQFAGQRLKLDYHALAPGTPLSALQTNSMIAATKHRIFEMTFNASGSSFAGKANPNAAQMANTTNIPAIA